MKLTPQPAPPIINHHFIQREGIWHKVPGRIKMAVYYKNEEDMDTTIEQLFQPVFSLLSDLDHAALKRRLHDCKHKLYAVRWHNKAIIDAIERQARELQNSAGTFSGVTAVRLDPGLIYLTEDFLFQVVSSIEILTQALHNVIPCLKYHIENQTSARKKFLEGKKLVDRLFKEGEDPFANYLKTGWDDWLDELTNMRNTITHASALKDFRCFQEDPYDGQCVVIEYPKMPSGEQVHDYCEEVLGNVLKLYDNAFSLFPRWVNA